MGIINTKGVEVYIQVGTGTATDITPLSITKAAPAVVEVVSVAGLAKGDVVTFANTTFSELDGKTFAIGEIDSELSTFTVLGSDTTNSTGVLPTTGAKASVVESVDMVKMCLSSMEIGADSVNNVDVSTYCDPSAQIPGKATPGTITLSGYAAKDDTGLAEVIKAAEDQQVRAFEIVLPGDNGYIVGQISLAGLSYGVPLEGAVTFTVSGTQASKIRWVY
jgi:predicted secreted protein